MKAFTSSLCLAIATLALAACGSSDSASEPAMAENVEIPAEEAVAPLPPAATPVADPAAVITSAATTAPGETVEPVAGAAPVTSATIEPAPAASVPTTTASPAASEKKM